MGRGEGSTATDSKDILYGQVGPRNIDRLETINLTLEQRKMLDKQKELDLSMEALNEIIASVAKDEFEAMKETDSAPVDQEELDDYIAGIIEENGADSPISQYEYLIGMLGLNEALEELQMQANGLVG